METKRVIKNINMSMKWLTNLNYNNNNSVININNINKKQSINHLNYSSIHNNMNILLDSH